MEFITNGSWRGALGAGLALRELQCVLSVANGLTDKQTALDTGISPRAVKGAVERAMFKLGAYRRAAMVAEAMRRGLIAPAMALFLAVITLSAMSSTDPALRVRRGGHGTVASARVMRRSEWVV